MLQNVFPQVREVETPNPLSFPAWEVESPNPPNFPAWEVESPNPPNFLAWEVESTNPPNFPVWEVEPLYLKLEIQLRKWVGRHPCSPR